MAQRCIHVAGVPQDQRIDYETQCAELIFLTLAVTLPEFPALAMKALACQPMAALSTIQLRENAAAIKRLVDEGQQMQGFRNAPKFAQGFGVV